MFRRIRLHSFPCKVLLMREQIIHGIVDAVKVSICIRARLRVALCLLLCRLSLSHKTDFVLCRQYNRLDVQSILLQKPEAFLRHSAGDGLCREIKKLLRHALSHRFHRGKNC